MSVSYLKRANGWKIDSMSPTGVDPDSLGRLPAGITLVFEETTPGSNRGTVRVSTQWEGASWALDTSGTPQKVKGTLRNGQEFEIPFPIASSRLSCKVFKLGVRRSKEDSKERNPDLEGSDLHPTEAGSWTAIEGG